MLARAQANPAQSATAAAALERARLFWASAPDQAYRHVRTEVKRMLAAGNYKTPVLPEAAVEALKLVKNPHVALDRIERLIAGDPPLAAKLLSLANSPVYRGVHPFESLRAALVRLGMEHTREVLAQAVLASHVFNVPQFQSLMGALAAESTGVALACTTLANQAGDSEGNAFLSGLLHDIGKAILLQILARLPEGLAAPVEEVERLLEEEHTEAGREAARRMRLADTVMVAISRHHHWEGGSEADKPAVLVSMGRRIWQASAPDASESQETWPEAPHLDLVEYQVNRVIDYIRRARPRLLETGAVLEGELAPR